MSVELKHEEAITKIIMSDILYADKGSSMIMMSGAVNPSTGETFSLTNPSGKFRSGTLKAYEMFLKRKGNLTAQEKEKLAILRSISKHFTKVREEHISSIKKALAAEKASKWKTIGDIIKPLPKPQIPTITKLPVSFGPKVAEPISIPIRFVTPRAVTMGSIPRVTGPLMSLGRIAAVAKFTVWTAVISTAITAVVEISARQQIKRLVRYQKELYKNIAKNSLRDLSGIVQKSLTDAGNSVEASITVDTSNFDKALKEYIRNSKKDCQDIVNQKAYWIAIRAIKETYKADKDQIRTTLEGPSDTFPNLTLAEAIVLTRNRQSVKKKMTRAELKREGKKLINQRIRAIGFLKSGWLPAVRILAPKVNKRYTVGLTRLGKGKDKGGAEPARQSTTSCKATIWSDIIADNNTKAQNYRKIGLQRALNAEAASMNAYVESKLRKRAEQFNRA